LHDAGLYRGLTAPAAGQSVSPIRWSRISNTFCGALPATMRSPISCSSPSLTVAV